MISQPAAERLHRAALREAEWIAIHGDAPEVKKVADRFRDSSFQERAALVLFFIRAIANDPELNLSKRRL